MESTFTKAKKMKMPFKKTFISDDEYILSFKSKLSNRSGIPLQMSIWGFCIGLILCSMAIDRIPSLAILPFFSFVIFIILWSQNPKTLKIRVTREGIYFREVKNIFNEDFAIKYTVKRQLAFKDFKANIVPIGDEAYIYASVNGGQPMRLTGYLKWKEVIHNQISHFNPERY